MRLVPLLAALAIVTLSAPPSPARTWSQEWTVGAHPAVQVATNDAHIRFHRGAPGQVGAIVEYTVQVWGLHTRVNEPVVQFEHHGDLVTVNARSHGNTFFFGGMNERFRIDVTVPANCDIQVRSGDGSVDLEPVAGTIDLQTGDGRIIAHGASGRLRLWTGDGGIDADGLDGELVAHSGDGHLRVAGRFDQLELSSGDGGVVATAARGSAVAQPWSVTTGDGSVTLRIPRDLRALLDASTNDGTVRVELPIGTRDRTSRHELRGQLNGGTVPLRVHTGDGSVTLGLSE